MQQIVSQYADDTSFTVRTEKTLFGWDFAKVWLANQVDEECCILVLS